MLIFQINQNASSAKLMGLKGESHYGFKGEKRTSREDEEQAKDLFVLFNTGLVLVTHAFLRECSSKLDKSLHHMLLTTLLPSAAEATASRPVHKRDAMTGRLNELAFFALPGEGKRSIAASNLSKHPAKIRTGLLHAKARRDEKAFTEERAMSGGAKAYDGKKMRAKNYGASDRNHVGKDLEKKKGMDGGKEDRRRGLRMGVGKFEGGMLKLSRSEIAFGSSKGDRGFRGKKGRRK